VLFLCPKGSERVNRKYNRPTEEQKIEILEKYASGGYTQETLAEEYGVSVTSIKNYLKLPEFAEIARKVAAQKKEEAESVELEFFPKIAKQIKGLLPKLIDIDEKQVEKLPIRDRIGAFKILAEFLLALKNSDNSEDDNKVEIVVSVKDYSMKDEDDED
jgi:transposase-like protein